MSVMKNNVDAYRQELSTLEEMVAKKREELESAEKAYVDSVAFYRIGETVRTSYKGKTGYLGITSRWMNSESGQIVYSMNPIKRNGGISKIGEIIRYEINLSPLTESDHLAISEG